MYGVASKEKSSRQSKLELHVGFIRLHGVEIWVAKKKLIICMQQTHGDIQLLRCCTCTCLELIVWGKIELYSLFGHWISGISQFSWRDKRFGSDFELFLLVLLPKFIDLEVSMGVLLFSRRSQPKLIEIQVFWCIYKKTMFFNDTWLLYKCLNSKFKHSYSKIADSGKEEQKFQHFILFQDTLYISDLYQCPLFPTLC